MSKQINIQKVVILMQVPTILDKLFMFIVGGHYEFIDVELSLGKIGEAADT